MPKPAVTRYNVDALVQARKTAFRIKQNNLRDPKPKHGELGIKIEIRRVDSPGIDLVLEFYGRVIKKGLSGVPSTQYPSAALIWQGKRIRGIDHKIKHDVVKNGHATGIIRGWHEHYWTDEDEDNSIRMPSPELKNCDLQAVIAWCSHQWNIEGIGVTERLFNE